MNATERKILWVDDEIDMLLAANPKAGNFVGG